MSREDLHYVTFKGKRAKEEAERWVNNNDIDIYERKEANFGEEVHIFYFILR